ncbi:PilZ domain-containing protein [Spirochaeta africana]|uniref:PilZ domain-containing protein n=1 Tax=Spirochaeta africana (strain ATCC 700263 / DSM 8902 / Z-7692) TaxID=889378 RepID=H9UHA9_SPIAZ|nr:PilZ domain-containing protein [Spirochaeta africana]AFG36902.1 PilZ domain-containing protein [Spirochaeta africana DSM 8902]
MSITTSTQITRYYEDFKDIDITFTKEVIRASLLNTKQIYLKLLGYQWPCIIYSSSLSGAKIIANITPQLKKAMQQSKSGISLRFSFLQRDKRDPISFFVPCKVAGFTPYQSAKGNLHFINMNFTQRPPDDLIEILGRILEANSAAKHRRDERIVITAESIAGLGLNSKGGLLVVDGVPRKCIIRDLSFGGSKIILVGVAKFLVNKQIQLRLTFGDPQETLDIPGTIIRFEPVQGRDDLAAFAVQFDSEKIPMRLKMRINAYFKGRNKHKPVKQPNAKQPDPSEEQA